ncbi:L-arabinose isomerase [Silvibacterium sp.]|uniref:L-arabinose isomerase n=1 Tax=Silvibacterium sp. TaxID=1964179 RepID=UPI0039E519B8
MSNLKSLEIWFVTGSQHLYGEDALRKVSANAQVIGQYFAGQPAIPVRLVTKPIVTRSEEIQSVCEAANQSTACIGLIFWMHTFSPAKMWIKGLRLLNKPFLHLHTQFNEPLPWSTIDMDFMNLNQSAHGDREFGFITARLDLPRKVVVGYWKDIETIDQIGAWTRAAVGLYESRHLKVARFGDNMREVAVTEGDKVEAEKVFGYSVSGYGIGDLTDRMIAFSETDVSQLVEEYRDRYTIVGAHDRPESLAAAARIELGLRAFLTDGGFGAFTDTFEDLHGMRQLPGIAVQRLMGDGFGFAGEGDWKTAALVRIMKTMATGLVGGTSFMEDYTYDFSGTPKILGSHMLEICPSIAEAKPALEVHPLGIGGKEDPVRLVFTAPQGEAIVSSVIDMGNRFRLIVNEVDVIPPEQELPRLPVARAVWLPRPNLKVAAAAWIYAGGAHHTGFSQALRTEHMADLAEMLGIELVRIDKTTDIPRFRQELRWSSVAYSLGR